MQGFIVFIVLQQPIQRIVVAEQGMCRIKARRRFEAAAANQPVCQQAALWALCCVMPWQALQAAAAKAVFTAIMAGTQQAGLLQDSIENMLKI